MNISTTIIGIDCAAQDKNVGLALGHFDANGCHVSNVTLGSIESSVLETITGWITDNQPTLIAFDAPLGWPTDLGKSLHLHKAGAHISAEPEMLFNRLTDKNVRNQIGKKPLDVGADRIARTAHSALKLLNQLRAQTGESIPLLTTAPTMNSKVCAIEVYPAATLIVKGFMIQGYKKKDGLQARKSILRSLENHINLPKGTDLMEQNDDALDATICVLAGVDFLGKNVIIPSQSVIQFAEKEGWIWVQKPCL